MYCRVYGNMAEQIGIYQQLQKICWDKVCCMNVFRENFDKFGLKILCIPKTFPAPSPMPGCLGQISPFRNIMDLGVGDTYC